MPIRCCNGCVPPKRTPTCHATCPDYIREKAEHDKQAAADYKRRSLKTGLILQQERAVIRAARGKRMNRRESE